MVSFKYNEIPDGKSSQKLDVDPTTFEIDDVTINSIQLVLFFNKSENSTKVDFDLTAGVTFVCDRSLEEFEQTLSGSYSVVFKLGLSKDEENEDGSFKALQTGGDKLDLTNEVRDTILLNVPIKKLHPRYITEDGQPTEFNETYSDGETNDPRWDALKKLKNN